MRRGTIRYHQLVNKLNRIRNEAAGGGNKSISGIVNRPEANFLGERWVGMDIGKRPQPKGQEY
jgi:hypothetical protein